MIEIFFVIDGGEPIKCLAQVVPRIGATVRINGHGNCRVDSEVHDFTQNEFVDFTNGKSERSGYGTIYVYATKQDARDSGGANQETMLVREGKDAEPD